jgi:hypothetical protein
MNKLLDYLAFLILFIFLGYAILIQPLIICIILFVWSFIRVFHKYFL